MTNKSGEKPPLHIIVTDSEKVCYQPTQIMLEWLRADSSKGMKWKLSVAKYKVIGTYIHRHMNGHITM